MTARGAKPSGQRPAGELAIPAVTGEILTSEDFDDFAPDDLSPAALAIYHDLAKDLVERRVFIPSDSIMLGELAELLVTAREARKRMRDADFDPESPEAKRLRASYIQSLKLAMSIAGEYAISPVARFRLGLTRVQGASLLANLGIKDG